MIFGGIEAGGTKFVVGVGTAEGGSRATTQIPTGDPEETIARAAAFLRDNAPPEGLAGIGIGSFGPIELDIASPRYGTILETPKPGWRGFDLRGGVARLTGITPAMETDVNAAALAEAKLGTGRRRQGARGDLAYVTVGTGIGVGLISGGRAVHGIAHPEMGHILPRRHPGHEHFAGICPYHRDCLEGLASGSAIRAAWGAGLDALPADHPAWEIEAAYIAQLCATLILTLAPPTIVLGGGVMRQTALFDPIRKDTAALLNGYAAGGDRAALASRIVPPGCAEASGLLGAYLVAEQRFGDCSRSESG